MRKIYEYTTPQQLREELKELDGISGLYIIDFPDSIQWEGEEIESCYVGQTHDLYERLTAHIGNMDLTNRGNSTRSYKIERTYFERYRTYQIVVYKCPEDELNFYEEFLVWKYGSFSKSRYLRGSRNMIREGIAEDFQHFTQEDWNNFAMPTIPIYQKPKDVSPKADSMLTYLLNKSKQPKPEKDYGF